MNDSTEATSEDTPLLKQARELSQQQPVLRENLDAITASWAREQSRCKKLLDTLGQGKSIALASKLAAADFDEVFKTASEWKEAWYPAVRTPLALMTVLIQLDNKE